MAAELQFDVAEQTFIRLDVKDLMRCKCVCKSWQSLISDPCFAKAHVKYAYNNVCKNNKLVRRIVTSSPNRMVGSSNGLVCISSLAAKLVIINPLTKELIKLPMSSSFYRYKADSLCWGFGYDSSIDDYKVIVGFLKGDAPTRFVMLTWKTNTWKQIGSVNYRNIGRQPAAILCNGALHWFMKTTNCRNNENNVILSFDLSLNEFKEIPLPDEDYCSYKSRNDHRLAIIDECLCIWDGQRPSDMWVMKNYNVKESWVRTDLYQYGDYPATHRINYHHVDLLRGCISHDIYLWSAFCIDDPVFVPSLVSPHLYSGRPRKALKMVLKNNKRGVQAGPVRGEQRQTKNGKKNV